MLYNIYKIISKNADNSGALVASAADSEDSWTAVRLPADRRIMID
jgi:hypothetical protein